MYPPSGTAQAESHRLSLRRAETLATSIDQPRPASFFPSTSLDLQEQSHERALAMRICLGKDRFQLIAGRLP